MVLFVIIHFILEINAGEGREDQQGKKIELTTEISMHMRAHKGRKKKTKHIHKILPYKHPTCMRMRMHIQLKCNSQIQKERRREREKTIKTKAQINNKEQAKGEPRMNDGMME